MIQTTKISCRAQSGVVTHHITRADALELAKLGFPVCAVYAPDFDNGPIINGATIGCTCDKKTKCNDAGKHPVGGWGAATTDPAQIKRMFSGKIPRNLGIRTGKDFFVVDVDPPEGADSWIELKRKYGEPPTTVTAESGGGGRHLYFAHPGDEYMVRNSMTFMPGIHIKGDGDAGVVAPPSVHESGRLYSWLHSPSDTEIAVLPDLWFRLFLDKGVFAPKRQRLRVAASTASPFSTVSATSTVSTTKPPPLERASPAPFQRAGAGPEAREDVFPPCVNPSPNFAAAKSGFFELARRTVKRFVLTKTRTRDENMFPLARALRALPELRNIDADEHIDLLEDIFEIWYQPSKEFTRTPFEAAFEAFLRAFKNVNVPEGENVLEPAWAASKGKAPPNLGFRYRSKEMKRTAAFVYEIHMMTHGESWFLSGDYLAPKLGIKAKDPPREARRLLYYLVQRKVLVKEKSGGDFDDKGKRRANVYRFIGKVINE